MNRQKDRGRRGSEESSHRPAERRREAPDDGPAYRIVVPVSSLETGRSPLELEVDASRLELTEWMTPVSPLRIDGSIDRFGETLTIRATARVRSAETCARCTRPFEADIEEELLLYCDREGADEEELARELEEQGEVVYHDGVHLDITEPVRQALILSRPLTTLCRDDCRGLCAGCGADLNVEPCRCGGRAPDPRWEALKKLREP
jgi:uncharacterized protein